MENKTHRCYSCMYYQAYYTKALCCFDKLDYGICRKNANALCEKHGTCENWTSSWKRTDTRKKVALRKLDRLSDDISVMRQILQEESEK